MNAASLFHLERMAFLDAVLSEGASMDAATFVEGRTHWLRGLSSRLVTGRVERILRPLGPDVPVEQRAMFVLHCGLGHMLGLEDDDLAIGDSMHARMATDIISKVWRAGEVDAAIARYLVPAWISFYCVGRDTIRFDAAFLRSLVNSPVGRWAASQTVYDLNSQYIDRRLEVLVDSLARFDGHVVRQLLGVSSSQFDFPGTHIQAVQVLHALDRLAIEDTAATYLEHLAAFADSETDMTAVRDLNEARSIQLVGHSIPGAWPRSTGHHVPSWVRQVVIGRGARFWNGTTGFVPTWVFVAESEEELRAVHAWTYNPGIAVKSFAPHSSMELGIKLEFAPDDHGYAWYLYALDRVDQIHLRTLIHTKLLRVEVYRVTPDFELKFEWATGVQLDPRLEEILDILPEVEHVYKFGPLTTSERLTIMASLDHHNFEFVQRCMSHKRDAPSSALSSAFGRFLQVSHAAARQKALGGLSPGEVISESYERVRQTLASEPSNPTQALHLECLGKGRAYVLLRVAADDGHVEGWSAYTDETDRCRTDQWDLSSDLRLERVPPGAASLPLLIEGLGELVALLSRGITGLVVSLDQRMYGYPVHQALLELGFHDVSYTHALARLRPPRTSHRTAVVRGWSGSGSHRLQSVEKELSSVRTLYRSQESMDDLDLVDVIHLSGHAETGALNTDVIFRDSESSVISAAGVLQNLQCDGQVVVLAACNTGVVELQPNHLVETTPLDVAFLEAGAAAVVATSAPVNDVVAALFSLGFHHAYTSGASPWQAFIVGRDLVRRASAPAALETWLTARWSSWKTDLRRALGRAPSDWMLFRLSGQHWRLD
jgi:hypothetical protein